MNFHNIDIIFVKLVLIEDCGWRLVGIYQTSSFSPDLTIFGKDTSPFVVWAYGSFSMLLVSLVVNRGKWNDKPLLHYLNPIIKKLKYPLLLEFIQVGIK